MILALFCLYKAKILRELDTDNAVFLYLMWISTGFAVFAVSRSFGHILKQVLVLTGNPGIWHAISPYSGGVNTVSFMLVGLITLFFNQIWKINEKILSGRKELEDTHIQLRQLNQTLEHKVIERTERLAGSEYKARRIFEHSLDTILVTDERFNVSEINQAGVTLTGYGKTEMLEKKMGFKDFMALPSEWDRIRGLLDAHEYIVNEETDFLRLDTALVRVLITGGVDYGAFGCGKSFHFIIKDINDKKQMEQQIAQADKLAALGELSARVAHEINNPLGIILGYTQLLLTEKSGLEEALKTIEKHVKNCRNVVSDLLAFSRKGPDEMSRVDVTRVINGVTKFLSNHTDFRNVDIKLDLFGGGPLIVTGNEQELAQVIINLMINASHAVEKKGHIEITTGKSDAGRIFITVKDDGTGIPKKHLSKIFNPFLPPSPWARAPALAFPWATASFAAMAGKLRQEIGKQRERPLPSAFQPRRRMSADKKTGLGPQGA